MVCLLAILLYTGQNLSRKDRFVITTSESRFPSYRSYEVNYKRPFPVPRKDSGIYRTLVDIDGPGTYIMVYCSNKMTIDDLWGSVSNGLTSLQGRLDEGISNDEKLENECFDYVKNLYFGSSKEVAKDESQEARETEPDPLLVSELIKSHQCTKRLLISLFYQQKIVSADRNGFMTTYRDMRLPKILFDKPVEIANVVLDGQFIMKQNAIGFEEALAWNQGQLQYFQRDDPLHYWEERTLAGYEPYTGGPITKFIESNNAQVRSFMKKFNTWKFVEKCTPQYLGVRKMTSQGLNACREYIYRNTRQKVEKLISIPADGILYGVKICRPMEWPDEGFSVEKSLEFRERRVIKKS